MLTVNVRGSAHIMSREDSVEDDNALFLAGLNTSQHGVVQLTLVGNTARVSTSDATVNTLLVSDGAGKAADLAYCAVAVPHL